MANSNVLFAFFRYDILFRNRLSRIVPLFPIFRVVSGFNLNHYRTVCTSLYAACPGARRFSEARFDVILDYSTGVVYFPAVKGYSSNFEYKSPKQGQPPTDHVQNVPVCTGYAVKVASPIFLKKIRFVSYKEQA